MAIHNYYNGSLIISHLGEGNDRFEVKRDGRSDLECKEEGERPRKFDDREQRIAELLEFGEAAVEFTTLAEAISVAKGRDHKAHEAAHVKKQKDAAARLHIKRQARKAARAEEVAPKPKPKPKPKAAGDAKQ